MMNEKQLAQYQRPVNANYQYHGSEPQCDSADFDLARLPNQGSSDFWRFLLVLASDSPRLGSPGTTQPHFQAGLGDDRLEGGLPVTDAEYITMTTNGKAFYKL